MKYFLSFLLCWSLNANAHDNSQARSEFFQLLESGGTVTRYSYVVEYQTMDGLYIGIDALVQVKSGRRICVFGVDRGQDQAGGVLELDTKFLCMTYFKPAPPAGDGQGGTAGAGNLKPEPVARIVLHDAIENFPEHIRIEFVEE